MGYGVPIDELVHEGVVVHVARRQEERGVALGQPVHRAIEEAPLAHGGCRRSQLAQEGGRTNERIVGAFL